MTSIAIKGSWVVGWGENGHHVIEDGVVVTRDDRIAFVGFQGTRTARPPTGLSTPPACWSLPA